jgi:UDP-galactopyranose mutase
MPEQKSVLVVGAGFSGGVIARLLAENGHRVTVIDERAHVAGNCHTARDPATGIMLHVYGPHIFHTDDDEVWNFITRHCTMMPYRHQVKAMVGGRVYALPINLHTINQFFDRALSPHEARLFVESLSEGQDGAEPQSFQDQGLRFVGRALYEAFFHGYTLKQWEVSPDRLPASILKRLPLRFTYDDNYFFHRHQGIPREGYTAAVDSILDHPLITVRLRTRAETLGADSFDHQVYTGPLDRFFDYGFGRLGYRTLRFEKDTVDAPYQGTAVMNYCDLSVPYTRITEHMYFAPWEADSFRRSVIYREYSATAGADDIPYYPVRLIDDKALLNRYVAQAQATPGVTFAGRLGTYAYLDMDVAIRRAMDVGHHLMQCFAQSRTPDAFVHPV